MHLIDNAYICNLIDDKIMVGSTGFYTSANFCIQPLKASNLSPSNAQGMKAEVVMSIVRQVIRSSPVLKGPDPGRM
jgi:hypothetical protein